eukprot:g5956.t1
MSTTKEINTKAVQQTGNDAVQAKLSMVKAGYIDDPFIQFFAKTTNFRRGSPLINRGYYARVKAIDLILREFLQEGGKKQVVNLGAGRDTTFWRLKAEQRKTQVQWFEIDYPEVTAYKAEIVRGTQELKELIGDEVSVANEENKKNFPGEIHTNHYHLIPNDLNNVKKLEQKLKEAGIEPNTTTLVIAECVLAYMEPNKGDELIEWTEQFFKRIEFVTYEPILIDDAFGKIMMKNFKEKGCDLRGIMTTEKGIKRWKRREGGGRRGNGGEEKGAGRGWTEVRGGDMNKVWNWIKQKDEKEVERITKIEIFDEFEEWWLFMKHYGITVAWKGEKKNKFLEK